jgi:SAM-dependent methyltransferase
MIFGKFLKIAAQLQSLKTYQISKKRTDMENFHQDNGAAWNVTAAIYERDEQRDIEFLRAGGNALLAPEKAVLRDLGQWCRRAIHLQCAGGLETLSLLKQGAGEVVGIDISERMIVSARRKTEALSARADWYCCDILSAPAALDGTADLVHTGRGALLWMMDLDAWARLVYRLLKPGGRLHIFEGHPLDRVWDFQATSYQLDAERGDYFSQVPGGGEIWPKPFIDRQEEVDPASIRLHDRQWTLGQIINTVIRAGLQVDYFNEYSLPFWDQFKEIPEEMLQKLPHTFTLLAKKQEFE